MEQVENRLAINTMIEQTTVASQLTLIIFSVNRSRKLGKGLIVRALTIAWRTTVLKAVPVTNRRRRRWVHRRWRLRSDGLAIVRLRVRSSGGSKLAAARH